MDASAESDRYACPRCGAVTTRPLLVEAGYSCRRCTFEVAHLDLAPNGSVRSVIGWLRTSGDLLHERYRVTSVLGKGGFAATYLVEDSLLKGKRRAVKEIPAIQYDEYETNLLSRLRHPAIPDISDRFETDDMVYLVLEFGGNRTLEMERKANNGTIPLTKLIPWIQQLCDVLTYLHGQTPPIVHRDLKPDNILLDENDRIMLIDFGIAKEADGFAMTRTIARSASHGFSPPEQVLGSGTDQRSDVYALGATVYLLLTGTVPPAAHERVAGRGLVAPRKLNPAIPPDLEAAIVQALDLNINHRQQSIRELSRVFESGALAEGPAPPNQLFVARTERLPSGPPTLASAGPAPRSAPGAAAARARVSPDGVAPRQFAHRRMSWALWMLVPVLLIVAGIAWFALRPGASPRTEPQDTANLKVGVPTGPGAPPADATHGGTMAPTGQTPTEVEGPVGQQPGNAATEALKAGRKADAVTASSGEGPGAQARPVQPPAPTIAGPRTGRPPTAAKQQSKPSIWEGAIRREGATRID